MRITQQELAEITTVIESLVNLRDTEGTVIRTATLATVIDTEVTVTYHDDSEEYSIEVSE